MPHPLQPLHHRRHRCYDLFVAPGGGIIGVVQDGVGRVEGHPGPGIEGVACGVELLRRVSFERGDMGILGWWVMDFVEPFVGLGDCCGWDCHFLWWC